MNQSGEKIIMSQRLAENWENRKNEMDIISQITDAFKLTSNVYQQDNICMMEYVGNMWYVSFSGVLNYFLGSPIQHTINKSDICLSDTFGNPLGELVQSLYEYRLPQQKITNS